MSAARQHPSTGGKRPRAVYRNQPGPPNFAIVNFLDDSGKKTSEQEIVPVLWIINGKKTMCYWPKGECTKKELDRLVAAETPPNKEDFTPFPARVLETGCTLAQAKARFDQLAEFSNIEETEAQSNERHQDTDSVGEDESSSDDSNHAPYGRKKNEKKGKAGKKSKSRDALSSFEYEEDPEDTINASKSDNNVKSKTDTSASLVSNKSNNVNNNRVASPLSMGRNLFTQTSKTSVSGEDTSHSQCVTKDQFEVFQLKLFRKLNMILETLNEIQVKSAKPRELVSLPKTVSEHCKTPVEDIESLECLDKLLATKTVQTEIANYLSQLGGKNYKDFLTRAVPLLIKDELCCLTNWSGSAIAPGTKDAKGNEITREFKKTFSNLHNIINTFIIAARQVDAAATGCFVESFLKKWLLNYKDRMTPRSHMPKPNIEKSKSPKKKKPT